jgi:hypothetical protein
MVNGNEAGASGPTYSNASLVDGDKVSVVMANAAGGCGGAPISSNVIEVKMGTAPEVKTNTEIKIFEGFSAKLTAISENPLTYSWTPAAGVTAANTASPIVKPAKTTTYKVTGINTSGCAGTAEVTVTVVKKITMAKTISVAKGEIFKIAEVDPAFTLGSFQVSNSVGKVVFTTTDITKGWNGTIGGAKGTAGMYTYSITGTLQTGKVNLKGSVQLIP